MMSVAAINEKIDKRLLHDLYSISRDAVSDCYITIPVIDARRIVRKLIDQNSLMLSKDIPREVSFVFLDSLTDISLFVFLRHKQPIYYIKFISCLNKINLNIIEILEEYESQLPRPKGRGL